MLLAILIAKISFVLFLVTHVIIFHKSPPKKRFRTMVMIAMASLVFYAIALRIVHGTAMAEAVNTIIAPDIVSVLNSIFVYLFLLFFYAQLIVIFDSSVSTRIMVDIDESAQRRLTLREIRSGYSLEEKFKDELEDMQYLDRIKKEGDYYKNTPKGSTHAKVIGFLRSYLNIGGHQ